MEKIKKGFGYMGSKEKYLKLIHDTFHSVKDEVEQFYDPFGGSIIVSANVKNWFPNIRCICSVIDDYIIDVFVNARDKQEILDYLVEFQKEACEIIGIETSELSTSIIRKLHKERKENDTWNKLKNLFNKYIGKDLCPCCGKCLSSSKKIKRDSRQSACMLFFGFALSTLGKSWAPSKIQIYKKYFKAVEKIDDLNTNLFDYTKTFKNTFIFLDPPYVQSMRKDKSGYIGNKYTAENSVSEWDNDSNAELVDFIKNNEGNNNIYFVCGSQGNNLDYLLKKYFEDKNYPIVTNDKLELIDGAVCEFKINKKQNTMGTSYEMNEYFYLFRN